MNMSLSWLNEEKTALHNYIEGAWEWDEFYTIHEQTKEMMNSVEHPVALITEFADKESIVMPKQLFTHARNLFNDFPDNRGMIIFVGQGMLLRTVISTLSKVIPLQITKNLKSVATIAEAYALLDIPNEMPPREQGYSN